MKILVIGFQRSGTTLLRRLIELHPDVFWMLHETRFLKKKSLTNMNEVSRYVRAYRSKKVQPYRGKDPIRETWGEKIPWYGNGSSILTYSRKWIKMFEDQTRIIHILRHPIDVALSNIKLRWAPNAKVVFRHYSQSVPRVIKALENEKCMLITFEDLVLNPKDKLKKVFEFCGLNASDEIIKEVTSAKKDKLRYFDGINSERAFAHKKIKDLKVKCKFDYDALMEKVNEKF